MTRYEALAVIEAIRATPEGGERYETLFGTELMALDSLPTIRLIYLAKLLENSWSNAYEEDLFAKKAEYAIESARREHRIWRVVATVCFLGATLSMLMCLRAS